jgi:heat shock protein HslJ
LLVGLLAALLLQGCAIRAPGIAGITPERLIGTQWLLEDLGGAGVLDRVQATLAFPQAGRIAGNGSCNRFTGSIADNGGKLQVGALASTRMGCAPAVGDQEAKYMAALEGAERMATDGPFLLVYTGKLPKPLRFTALK